MLKKASLLHECPCDLFDVTYCLLTMQVKVSRYAVGDKRSD